MQHYGIYIGAAYATVFLGLLYLTMRYLGLNKRIQKLLKER